MEIAKTKVHEAAVGLLDEVKDALASPEGCDVILRTVNATLTAAKTIVEAMSPGFVVPFEEMAFGWLGPKVGALIRTEVEKLDPTPDVPAPVNVVDVPTAAQVIAQATSAQVK